MVRGLPPGFRAPRRPSPDVFVTSTSTSTGAGETVFRGDYERRFSVDLMRKDMRLIAELARELQVPAPALELAAATFDRAAAAGHGARDFSIVAELQAEAAGTTLPTRR